MTSGTGRTGTPEAWLRAGGVVAALMVAGSQFADALAGGLDPVLKAVQQNSTTLSPAIVVTAWTIFIATLAAGFIAAFWTAMKRAERGMSDGRTHLLLAVQALLAMAVQQELMYLVAMELPLVLPLRIAIGWGAGAMLAVMGTTVAAAAFAHDAFVPSEGLRHLPYMWQVMLTGGAMAAWQTFAFCGGCLAAVERRHRDRKSVV